MLHRLLDSLDRIAITLWVGSLWVVGILVAPVLFDMLPDRQLAGEVAGRLFSIVAFVGLSCGAYLLLHCMWQTGRRALTRVFPWVVCLMLTLAVVSQFAIQPVLAGLKARALPAPVMQSALRHQFNAWHAAAGVIYVVECTLGLGLVVLRAKVEC